MIRAEGQGWQSWEDEAYMRLTGGGTKIFDVADGPDKAVAYLEDVCKKAETQRGPSNAASQDPMLPKDSTPAAQTAAV